MEPNSPSVDTSNDDPFDSLFNLESHHYTLGYNAGYRDGAAKSAIEARIFGVEKGFGKFMLMGKLRRRAEVWASKYINPESPDGMYSEGGDDKLNENGSRNTTAATRLDRHIATLLLLTDPATLDKANTDDAVAAFDDRHKRAQAKAKVVERILGEKSSSHRARGFAGNGSVSSGDAGAVGATADIENLKLKPG